MNTWKYLTAAIIYSMTAGVALADTKIKHDAPLPQHQSVMPQHGADSATLAKLAPYDGVAAPRD